jgi:hypothetical protein
MNSTLSDLGCGFMNEFIAERSKLIRQLADGADPFTKIRLLKLAEAYDQRLGLRSKPVYQRQEPIGLPPIRMGSSER